jgi:hypothetical protein
MAGVNQYRRRWSVQHQRLSRRSRRGAIGRGIPILCTVLAFGVALYIFGFIGPRGRSATPTPVPVLIPPPAPLAIPAPVGAFEPFGPLPAVAPFTTNGAPTLAYQLSGPLTGGAPRADAYQVVWGTVSTAQVGTLAQRFGVTGPVQQVKPGSYVVEGNGHLSVDAKAIIYTPPAGQPSGDPLPDDRAAISGARNWLGAHDLMPPDAGPADVQRRADTLDVIFHPKALPDVLSVRPGVRVRMGPGGAVTEVEKAWPTTLQPGAYDLLSLDEAWQQAPKRGVVDVHAPAGTALPPDATAIINTVSLSYAMGTDAKGMDYLQPVYVFGGAVPLPEQGGNATIRLAVPAVRNIKAG